MCAYFNSQNEKTFWENRTQNENATLRYLNTFHWGIIIIVIKRMWIVEINNSTWRGVVLRDCESLAVCFCFFSVVVFFFCCSLPHSQTIRGGPLTFHVNYLFASHGPLRFCAEVHEQKDERIKRTASLPSPPESTFVIETERADSSLMKGKHVACLHKRQTKKNKREREREKHTGERGNVIWSNFMKSSYDQLQQRPQQCRWLSLSFGTEESLESHCNGKYVRMHSFWV